MKTAFCIFILLCLCVPSLHFLGVGSYVKLHGVEPDVKRPDFSASAVCEGSFQRDFEKWWTRVFALRAEMLRTKHQIYDWANFGQFHAGYFGSIIQGRNHQLFEIGYINTRYESGFNRNRQIELSRRLRVLQDLLAQRGVKLLVIASPTKTEVYDEYIPQRYKWFGKTVTQRYTSWVDCLAEFEIPHVNSIPIARQIRRVEKIPSFPYSGTHWTHYCAGKVLRRGFELIGFRDLTETDIVLHQDPIGAERDLADLLNLWVKYPLGLEYYPELRFSTVGRPARKVSIIGNSFSGEIRNIVKRNNLSFQIAFSGNAPIKSHEVQDFVNGSDCVIFVYPTALPHFETKVEQLISYLEEHPSEAVSAVTRLEYGKKYVFDQDLPANIEGLSKVEGSSRWSFQEWVLISIRVPQDTSSVDVRFRLLPFYGGPRGNQVVDVYVGGKYLATWEFERGKNVPHTSICIPRKAMDAGETINFELRIRDPKSPMSLGVSSDPRLLGLRFLGLEIQKIGQSVGVE